MKIQRDEETARKERKKEKKREKKEKEKARENGEIDNKKHRHKKRHREERSQEDQKGGDPHKRRKYETENLEKSSVTEEHGHPVGSQNSSDSTLNSNKRQKQSLSSSDGKHNSGECDYASSLPGEGCLLVGFVSFTVTLIFFLQLVIIYVKEAFSGSGCLCRGTKILKFFPARNSLTLPREGLRMPSLKGCMNLLLDLAEIQENIAVLLLEMWTKNSL